MAENYILDVIRDIYWLSKEYVFKYDPINPLGFIGIEYANFRYNALYPLAMLRVSSDLKGSIWAGINEIINETLKELKIPKRCLDDYIKEHKDVLEQISMELGI